MKIEKRSAATSAPSAAITAANYAEQAAAFARFKGAGFVIRALDGTHGALMTGEPATEPQWIAWMGYFLAKKIPHRAALKRGLMTVPCEWPNGFDVDWGPNDPTAFLPRRPFVPHGRERVAALFRELMASIWRDTPARSAPRTSEDLAGDFQRAPPQVSPALAARLNAERGHARQMIGASDGG